MNADEEHMWKVMEFLLGKEYQTMMKMATELVLQNCSGQEAAKLRKNMKLAIEESKHIKID